MRSQRMSKDELLNILSKLKEDSDKEVAHVIADASLIKYINDSEITKAYEEIERWYA